MIAGEIGQDEFGVTAKLPENLATSAARRGERGSIGDHDNALQFCCALGDCFEDSDAFGADGKSVGGVFDVAPGVDMTVFIFESATDFEIGKRSVGAFANGLGDVD